MSTSIIFLGLIIIICFLLVVAIMVQNPKGGGLSSSFGGSGGQQMGGVKKTGDFLDKSTWTLATALLVLILLYNVSIMENQTVPKSRIMNDEAPTSAPANDQPVPAQDQNGTKTVTPGEEAMQPAGTKDDADQ